MPSWNIHTAHVESLLGKRQADDLGIADTNAFLFGNYVPDIYVGFMVPDALLHIDYCITHFAQMNLIPMPDADFFWDHYIARRRPSSPVGLSLTLGAWAHLVADRYYNGWFRSFVLSHDVPKGEEMRVGKQGDFDLFGRSLGIESLVNPTPDLIDAAWKFYPYRILNDDVKRAVQAANDIVRKSKEASPNAEEYRLLSAEWLTGVFQACDERLSAWLEAWQRLDAQKAPCLAVDVRREGGLPPAVQDDPHWMDALKQQAG